MNAKASRHERELQTGLLGQPSKRKGHPISPANRVPKACTPREVIRLMVRTDYLISNWMRNRNTIEFLGIWEQLNNASLNSIEFDGIKKQAGLNSFILTAKQWVEKTGAVGLVSKAGRRAAAAIPPACSPNTRTSAKALKAEQSVRNAAEITGKDASTVQRVKAAFDSSHGSVAVESLGGDFVSRSASHRRL